MAKKDNMDIVSRIKDILDDADSHEPEVQDNDEKLYDKFLKVVKKNIGADIKRHEVKGRVLIVWLSKDSYHAKQELFTTQGKQDWIYDNGLVLLSVHYDVEPEAVKLYFTKYKNVEDG